MTGRITANKELIEDFEYSKPPLLLDIFPKELILVTNVDKKYKFTGNLTPQKIKRSQTYNKIAL